MAILGSFYKQPADTQDYDINCNAWLTALDDTIASVTASVTSGITLISCTAGSGIVKTWLSGGKDGVTYTITILIATVGGRIKQAEFQVKVKDT